MSAFRSSPQGMRALDAGTVFGAALAAWLAPALASWLVSLVFGILPRFAGAEALSGFFWFAAYSPIASWRGIILLVPGALLLVRLGGFGWATMLLTGAAIGLAVPLLWPGFGPETLAGSGPVALALCVWTGLIAALAFWLWVRHFNPNVLRRAAA